MGNAWTLESFSAMGAVKRIFSIPRLKRWKCQIECSSSLASSLNHVTIRSMKLAEALILRADYQKRAEQLRGRIVNNAKAQEGDTPSEDPNRLLQELDDLSSGLTDLIQRINKTNSETPYGGDKTLTDALAERDVLSLKRKIYSELAKAASVTQTRYSRSEVKFRSTVDVVSIQKQVDDMSKAYREMDAQIQALNWATDLLE